MHFPTSTWEMQYKNVDPPPVGTISQVLPQNGFEGLAYDKLLEICNTAF
jgi:hypothetical protein